MKFQDAMDRLKVLAQGRDHSVLITGSSWSGITVSLYISTSDNSPTYHSGDCPTFEQALDRIESDMTAPAPNTAEIVDSVDEAMQTAAEYLEDHRAEAVGGVA